MGTTASRRRTVTITLGAVALVLLAAYTAVNAFNLKFLAPATTGDIVGFVALSVLVFLIFIAVYATSSTKRIAPRAMVQFLLRLALASMGTALLAVRRL